MFPDAVSYDMFPIVPQHIEDLIFEAIGEIVPVSF